MRAPAKQRMILALDIEDGNDGAAHFNFHPRTGWKVPNQVQAKGCARVYVRLAANWADPTGAVHGAGDFVDVDVVTLAELEEQGVVENPEEAGRPEWTGPGKAEEPTQAWIGPGDESDGADEAEAPDADEEDR